MKTFKVYDDEGILSVGTLEECKVELLNWLKSPEAKSTYFASDIHNIRNKIKELSAEGEIEGFHFKEICEDCSLMIDDILNFFNIGQHKSAIELYNNLKFTRTFEDFSKDIMVLNENQLRDLNKVSFLAIQQ